MKKTYLQLMPFLVAGGLFLSSCNKEEITKSDPFTEYPTEFSDKSVTENKTQLEDNGIQMINNMSELKNTISIKSSISFTHFLGQQTPDNPNQRRIVAHQATTLMQILSSFAQNKITTTKVLSSLRTTEDTTAGTNPQSLQEAFDMNKGIFSWNSSTKQWDFAESGDKIVFKFPSDTAGTINNASFTVFNYKGVKVSNVVLQENSDYTGDLPETLNAELVINGKKEMEYSFVAKYNTAGDPTSVSTSLMISPFKLTASASNTTSEIKADYSFNKGDQVLMAVGSKATGNFTSTSVNDPDKTGDVIYKANAYFQVFNIKFMGEGDIKSIEAAVDNAATIEEEVAAINKHYKMVVLYVDSNEKIADTEFYATTRTYEKAGTCYYDANWELICNPTTTVTEENVDVRLLFTDKTKADFATYFGEGFENIEAKFTEFSDDVENDF